MKTSARNQFFGRVSHIHSGSVNDEIEIELTGGDKLVAIITQTSTEHLGLAVGVEVFALIKASSVLLMTDLSHSKVSARNVLSGEISDIKTGQVNSEISIKLPGGDTVVAVITNESAQRLELQTGKAVSAVIKASNIIIGLNESQAN